MHAESSNCLHDEFKRDGDTSQYCHITEVHPLGLPSIEYLTSLDGLQSENGIHFSVKDM